MSDGDEAPEQDDDDHLELQIASAADPPEMRQLKARHRRETRDGDQMWRSVLGTEVGRRELWKILREAGTFEDRFALAGQLQMPVGEQTWFHAGEKSFGLRLYHQWLKIDHQNIYLMHLENDPRFSVPRPPSRKRRSE